PRPAQFARLNYQRGPRRCRPPPPPPPSRSRKPPPPPPPYPPRPPPPPPGRGPRSVFGRASFTLSARPLISLPFNAEIARSASPSFVISTNAKPLDRPVSRSVMMLTRSTAP